MQENNFIDKIKDGYRYAVNKVKGRSRGNSGLLRGEYQTTEMIAPRNTMMRKSRTKKVR